ncbi:MAG: PAS domain S-box protein, partial [Deltaproteobacteria bacterium]|nr:PAS domain S-box protein [Deltaproteobacteria bacterium]
MKAQTLAIIYCDEQRPHEGPCAQLAQALREAGHTIEDVHDLNGVTERGEGCGVLLLDPEDFRGALSLNEGASPPLLLTPVIPIGSEVGAEFATLWDTGAADVIPWPMNVDVVCRRLSKLQERWLLGAELQERRRNYQLLNDAGADFDQSADFEDALAEALRRIAEVAGAARSLAMVWSESEKEAFLLGASDDPTAIGIPLDLSVFSELKGVFEARQPCAVPRVDLQPRVASYDLAAKEESGAIWVQPLLVEGEAFGALELHLVPGREISPVVLEFVGCMASLLAPRIKLSQTYQALSERTRRRRALAAPSSESTLQRHRDFYERASDGVVVLDPELRMLYLNPMGEQITGYAVDGVAGRPFVDLIPSLQREPFAKLLADIEHWQRGQVFDLPLRTTSGDPIIVSVSTNASAGGEEL